MAATLPARVNGTAGNPAGMPIANSDHQAFDYGIDQKDAPTEKTTAQQSSSAAISVTSSSRPSTATSGIGVANPGHSQSFALRAIHQTPSSASATKRNNDQSLQGTRTIKDIERGAPGDPIGRSRSQVNPDVQKMKNAYFESEFAASNRGPDPLRTRVENEAIVMAEFKTNVIIADEFNFMTDLSYLLSNRYQRPISSIVVSVTHSCCMMFGGSFDSAYTLTIHALPSLTQPITNKRNAALLQKHFEDNLGVRLSRGYVRFVPTPEDEVACGGKTLAAEMEDLERVVSSDENAAVTRKASKQKSNRRLRPKSFATLKTSSMVDLKVPTPPPSSRSEHMHIGPIPEVPPTPPDDSKMLVGMEPPRKTAGRRKSFKFSLFSSSKAAAATAEARSNGT